MGYPPATRSHATASNEALSCRSRIAYVLRRNTAPLAIVSGLLLTVATSGWLVLRSLSTGTGGLEIRVNWTAIVALGMPLVGLAFWLVRFFIRVALWQTPIRETGSQIGSSVPYPCSAGKPANPF